MYAPYLAEGNGDRTIEIDYCPRPQFRAFHRRKTRWAVLVCHRRAGKTVATVNDVIRRALVENKRDGRYAIIFPLRTQAKDTAWSYLKRFAAPVLRSEPSESELRVDVCTGASIRLYGSDNPDALRGPYLDGVVLDEFAQHRPDVWTGVVRPMLSDRRGWATFIGTPKGKNEFWDLWTAALRRVEGWFTMMLKASESKILDDDELADMLEDMGEDMYEQEMECSFEVAIKGAYYSKELRTMLAEGRIRELPIEKFARVYTGWDLGRDDATAIWFMQVIGRELRMIDYYENSGMALDHYVDELIARQRQYGYEYAAHYLPHDVQVTELMAKESRRAFLERNLGAHRIHVVPNHAILDGIKETRKSLGKTYIDPLRCFRGLEALRQYRRQWNDKRKAFEPHPHHDWTSHGADAKRILDVGYSEVKLPSPNQRTKNDAGTSSWSR